MRVVITARKFTHAACLSALLLVGFPYVRAQSTDSAMPSPVRLNEIEGTIPARDIGDPRLTDHYYALVGVPGDLLMTVDTKNLNGDIDVFASSGLRPLLKFTVYADSSSPTTKTIYFRKREDLIVRIEARTPNDDPGTYRLHFGGAFEPITSGPLLAENPNPPADLTAKTTTAKKGRRVSSVGARIEEQPEEVFIEPAAPTETAEASPVEPPPRRGRRGSPRRRTPATTPETTRDVAKAGEPDASDKPTALPTDKPTAQPGGEQPAETTASTRPPASRRATGRRSSPVRRPKPEPVQEPEPETGPRLVIETSDGALIDRSMSTVRRVTIENGQVVVVGKDGKINRIQLGNIVRMSISP